VFFAEILLDGNLELRAAGYTIPNVQVLMGRFHNHFDYKLPPRVILVAI
jgi:hypothetical protein